MPKKIPAPPAVSSGKKTISSPVWNVLGYLFSFSFAVTGIYLFWEVPVMGACYLLAGILLFPPLRKFISRKFKITALIVLYIIAGTLIIWSLFDLFLPKFPH